MNYLFLLLFFGITSCQAVYTKVSTEYFLSNHLMVGKAGYTSGIYYNNGYASDPVTYDSIPQWIHLFSSPDSVLKNDNFIVARNTKEYFIHDLISERSYIIKNRSERKFNAVYQQLNIPDSLNWKKR